jgi:hypothetical protein
MSEQDADIVTATCKILKCDPEHMLPRVQLLVASAAALWKIAEGRRELAEAKAAYEELNKQWIYPF